MSGKRSASESVERRECSFCKAQFLPVEPENECWLELAHLPWFSPYSFCSPECYLGYVDKKRVHGIKFAEISRDLNEFFGKIVEPLHRQFSMAPRSSNVYYDSKRYKIADNEMDVESQ